MYRNTMVGNFGVMDRLLQQQRERSEVRIARAADFFAFLTRETSCIAVVTVAEIVILIPVYFPP